MLERMNQYINDREFRFTIYENKIHIVNYKRIILLEDDSVMIKGNQKIIKIIGSNLVLNKLLEDEMLLTGNIQKIEVKNE